MSILLENAHIIDSKSPVHNQRCSILIENGVITSLDGKKAKRIINLQNQFLSVGWCDLNANFNDPGHEYKEDIQSGSAVAMYGGFTDVNLIPSTSPPIVSKSDVEYLLRRSSAQVDLHVCAGLSEDLNGENLNELLDLHASGANSFGEGDKPIWNTELMLKALQYTNAIGVPIVQNPRDRNLSHNTHMHEGITSTHLGLRGEPSLSEELIIQRDLEILRYSGGRIHFSKVSSAKSVGLIKQAKKDGLNVTADVAIHHLLFTDESVQDFDTNYKSLPPFRSETDRKALIKGVKEGAIDAISSNHRPQDQESKQLEFDLADSGAISLQTFYPSLLALVPEIPMEILIDRVSHGARNILGLQPISIDKGMPAKLTFFDSTKKWKLDSSTNKSKSKNSPFWNKELTGRVTGTINFTELNLFD